MYTYGATTQIVLTFFFSLSLCVGIHARKLVDQPLSFFSHFVPGFSPLWLAWFLAIVEVVRMVVRPLTLSLRIRIKMVAGHVFLILFRRSLAIGIIGAKGCLTATSLVLIGGFWLFEFSICMIQGLVFCLLVRSYTSR